MVGIDEVGRGALAGPLLVVACRQTGKLPTGLKDSKKLSRKKREKLALQITGICHIGPGWVTADEIDEYGLSVAMRIATERALTSIKAKNNELIIIDGVVNYADERFKNAKTMVRADEYEPVVSAASITAKVMRDAVMRQIAKDYPGFGFEDNVGYGTASHLRALKKFGPLEGVHRYSFGKVGGISS